MTTRTPVAGEVIDSRIADALEEVHVGMPGRVEKYDRASGRAQVQPLLKRGVQDETNTRRVERLPVVPNVPIVFPGVFHVEPGDIVWLVFGDGALDTFLSGTGGETNPGDDRSHALTDAVALPVMRANFPQVTGQFAIGREGGPIIEWDRTQVRVGGVGGQPTLMATAFLQALDTLVSAISAAVSGIPTGGAAAGAAIETASEAFRALAIGYLTTITQVR